MQERHSNLGSSPEIHCILSRSQTYKRYSFHFRVLSRCLSASATHGLGKAPLVINREGCKPALCCATNLQGLFWKKKRHLCERSPHRYRQGRWHAGVGWRDYGSLRPEYLLSNRNWNKSTARPASTCFKTSLFLRAHCVSMQAGQMV